MDPSGRHATGGVRPWLERCGLTAPWLWIVAGPNGSGKSSLIRHGVLDAWTGGLAALSPDDVVLALRADRPELSETELLRAAQAQSDGAVDTAIAEGRSVMVETVLSSDKFRRPVMDAAAAGFRFGFVFVTLASGDLNAARVQTRVARGGHDVPLDRIRARRERSHAAMTWFAARAALGLVFENSGRTPLLLAEKPLSAPGWSAIVPERLAALGLALPQAMLDLGGVPSP